MCTTALKNEFIQVIDLMPEDKVRRLLDVARDIAAVAQEETNAAAAHPVALDAMAENAPSQIANARKAFAAMEALRAESPFPRDVDYTKWRAENLADEDVRTLSRKAMKYVKASAN